MTAIQRMFPIESEFTRAFFADARHAEAWSPAVDVIENEDRYLVEMDLPGANKDSLKIRYENDVLVVEGEAARREPQEGERTWKSERKRGSFSRSFRLVKDIDPEGISAALDQGVLSLTLPKSEKARAREITIQD